MSDIMDTATSIVRALDGKRIIELADTHITVVDEAGRQMAMPPPVLFEDDERPDMREYGTTGMVSSGSTSFSLYLREDYNPDLQGIKALQTYDKMRKGDGQVRATLRLVKTPVLAARWYVEAGEDTAKGRKMAEFVWDNLTKWMSMSWQQFLLEALLMLDYGNYNFEKVFDFREWGGKQMVYWRKFAPRHPGDVVEWEYDKEGGPNGVHLYAEEGQPEHRFIEMKKLAAFTFDKEAGDMRGVSVLRPVYKHWYFKEQLYKIDAIQKERHGIGIPIIELPPNFTAEDKGLADELGRNLRTNEKAHVVQPPNWKITFAKLEGNLVDCMTSIEHHDMQIARNILGQFINADRQVQQEIFLKATRFIAEIVRDVINKYCIPQLVRYNWGEREAYPELKVRRIGDTVDWRTISFAMRNFVGAGILTPDEEMEKWIRNEMDLPAMDTDTARIIIQPVVTNEIPDGTPDGFPGSGDATTAATRENKGVGTTVNAPRGNAANSPQLPRVGPPRQAPVGTSTQARGTGSNGRVGRDASGG
jgi:hypothetical protein